MPAPVANQRVMVLARVHQRDGEPQRDQRVEGRRLGLALLAVLVDPRQVDHTEHLHQTAQRLQLASKKNKDNEKEEQFIFTYKF